RGLARGGFTGSAATVAARGGGARPPQTGVRSCAAFTHSGTARVGENRAGTLHLGSGGETSSGGALAQCGYPSPMGRAYRLVSGPRTDRELSEYRSRPACLPDLAHLPIRDPARSGLCGARLVN